MALVEEAAAYLEGPGRLEARRLPAELAYSYATESMALTTRLMLAASWLLIQRAVNEGRMTREQALQEEGELKLKAGGGVACGDDFERLPATFRSLILRSLKLFERVLCMQRILAASERQGGDAPPNEVRDQHDELADVFAPPAPTHDTTASDKDTI